MQKEPIEFGKPSANSHASMVAPQISDYMDYRQFLADWYAWKKRITASDIRPFNYPMFSAAANIKSPNYLKMIIEGRRNLSDDMIVKFSKALGFTKEQCEEFRSLVHSNQSRDAVTRNVSLEKLSEIRVARKLESGEIDRKTWEKIPNWVAWVIYAMVDQEGVKFDLPTLKKLLRGKASESEIQDALQGLLASGELVREESSGEIKKARHLIETPEGVPVALIRKLQTQLMLLGLESLHQDAPTEREFGTLTMSLTKTEFEEVKFRLRQLRKSLNKDNAIHRENGKGERVYQLNIQLFPVSNKVDGVAAPAQESSTKVDLKELLKNAGQIGRGNSVNALLGDALLAAQSFVEEPKN